MCIGPGITSPRANIQGTVVFQLVVNEKGRPVDISVLSPSASDSTSRRRLRLKNGN